MVVLSRNIDALLETSPRKVIQFIGSQGGEGTSTVVRDFAMVCATRLGKTVLLLDADPQSPSQHLSFDLQPKFGWEEILRNKRTFRKALCRIGKTGLMFIRISPVRRPCPRLFFLRDQGILGGGKERFELVLIDSAPASASPDGIALSRYVDGVVLVLSAERPASPWRKT